MAGTSTTELRLVRFTVEKYRHMAELGWFGDGRVELIDGEIVQMAPQKNAHAVGTGLVDDALRLIFGAGWWIRIQMPLSVGGQSEPEPDLAVVPGRPGDYTAHPSTARLVVEVSDTTLEHDRRKPGLYASAGVEEYWILNLVDRQLEVHRGPVADESAPFAARYRQRQILGPADTISPLAAPEQHVDVGTMLA